METNAMTNNIQGTGLGMSITKSIIDLMGGTIDIQSELGKGSVFTGDLIFSVHLEKKFVGSGFSPLAYTW